MDEINNDAPPMLLKVTTWALLVLLSSWPAKARADGARLARGATPVPLRVTLKAPWFVLMTMEPGRLPTAVGAKDTFTKQVGAATGGPTQLLVCA